MQGAQKRAQEQERADHRRRWIAGQAQDAQGPEVPVHQRLAGPHGDAPEAERHPGRDEGLLHEIVVADRRAAERHENVDRLARGGKPRLQRADLIGRDAEIDGEAAACVDHPGDRVIVGGDDLRRPERAAGRDQFVAGRQDGDPGVPAHGERGMVGGGRKREIARGETASGREQGLTGDEVDAGRTDIVARRGGRRRRIRSPSRSTPPE